jgi:hypothetical protein
MTLTAFPDGAVFTAFGLTGCMTIPTQGMELFLAHRGDVGMVAMAVETQTVTGAIGEVVVANKAVHGVMGAVRKGDRQQLCVPPQAGLPLPKHENQNNHHHSPTHNRDGRSHGCLLQP